MSLPGFRANGALFVSRCIGLGLQAAEARLLLALRAQRVESAYLRWYPFEVFAGGVFSCDMSPHVDHLETAVSEAERVMEEVFGGGLTEQELLEARNKMVVECEEARAESPEYWLAALEHLQSRLAPRRASQLETVAEGLGALSLCDVNAVMKRCLAGFSRRMVVGVGVQSPRSAAS